MSTIAPALAMRGLVDAASRPYRRAGRFAWHFARGKLRFDPVFGELLARGLIAPGAHVLDIGCGQGLLASWVRAAGAAGRAGRWPRDWAEAPLGARVTGIELMPRDIERARAALGVDADFVCADMRRTAFPRADVIVLLDALHYIDPADQDAVLARARSALCAGGRLVLRVGDAGAVRGFAFSQWIDRLVARWRRLPGRVDEGRSLRAWEARLAELGLAVESAPMHAGTPFANMLLVGSLVEADARPMTTLARGAAQP